MLKLKLTLKLIVAIALGADPVKISELKIKRDLSTFEKVKQSLSRTKDKIIENRKKLESQNTQLQRKIHRNRKTVHDLGSQYSDVQDKIRKIEDLT